MEARRERAVHYPDNDGRPIADNTLQFQWIVTLKENLDARLPDFVAGDLLWYPVEGRPDIRMAPDVLVALGRPKHRSGRLPHDQPGGSPSGAIEGGPYGPTGNSKKQGAGKPGLARDRPGFPGRCQGYRGSYRQWVEEGVPPQVVFEVLSPSNSMAEMVRKGHFYANYGALEFIVYDPDRNALYGWVVEDGQLRSVDEMDGWTSPLLGIRFDLGDTLTVTDRDGEVFETFGELRARADAAQERAARLAAKLRALGIDPDTV